MASSKHGKKQDKTREKKQIMNIEGNEQNDEVRKDGAYDNMKH